MQGASSGRWITRNRGSQECHDLVTLMEMSTCMPQMSDTDALSVDISPDGSLVKLLLRERVGHSHWYHAR